MEKFNQLAICIPSREDWKSGFGLSLAMMVGSLAFRPPLQDFGVRLLDNKGSRISALRRDLVIMALSSNASHILFLDDDMMFPSWTASRLIRHDKDIIAANCPKKQFPPAWTAKRNKESVISTGKTGLEEVDSVGTAIMLIKTEVFQRVEKPWFIDVTGAESKDDVGEDVSFCRAAKAKGFEIWIDHDLSKEIKHVGNYDYTCPAENEDMLINFFDLQTT